jgi:hypothetical protein
MAFESFDHDSKRENQRIEAFPFYAEPYTVQAHSANLAVVSNCG